MDWKLLWQLLLIFTFIMFIVMFIKFTYSGYKDIKNMLDK